MKAIRYSQLSDDAKGEWARIWQDKGWYIQDAKWGLSCIWCDPSTSGDDPLIEFEPHADGDWDVIDVVTAYYKSAIPDIADEVLREMFDKADDAERVEECEDALSRLLDDGRELGLTEWADDLMPQD